MNVSDPGMFFDPAMMTPTSTTVLWVGASNDLTHLATGGRVTRASYQITEDAIRFAAGLVSTREEILPLWAVRDVDLSQSLTQRARRVGDLTLKIDPDAAAMYGQLNLVLKSVENPSYVRELILTQSNHMRTYWNYVRQHMAVERQRAGASNISTNINTAAPNSPPEQGRDLMAQLSELAAMKQSGVLSDDEFTAAKARLLSS